MLSQAENVPVIIQAAIRPLPEPMRLERMQIASMEPRLLQWMPAAIASLPGLPAQVGPGPVDTAGPAVTDVMSIGQVDKPPVKISGALPNYPAWARAKRAEGSVTLRFLVTVEGTVGDIEIYSTTGDVRFAAAAREEIRKWRFSPAIDKSRPVTVWCVQTINFKLED
jgi:protein TonB